MNALGGRSPRLEDIAKTYCVEQRADLIINFDLVAIEGGTPAELLRSMSRAPCTASLCASSRLD